MTESIEEDRAFIDDVARIKTFIVRRLNDKELMSSCAPESVVGAVVMAVAELSGHLAAKSDIPISAIIGAMIDAYTFTVEESLGETKH